MHILIKRTKGGESIRSYLRLTIGALLFALSLSLFLEPAALVTGGVSGVAVLLAEFLPIGVGLLFLLLNLPILVIGTCKFGKRFMQATLYATLVSSVIAEGVSYLITPYLPFYAHPIMSAVLGGLFMGAGLGLIFRGGGTTGGTDILVKLLKLKFPAMREGILFFLIDSFVIALSAIAFRSPRAVLYSALSLFFCSVTIDLILYRKIKN